MAAERLSEHSLAAPVSVGPGGVEEVAAQLDCAVQRAVRFLVLAPRPARHAPHAIADIRYLPACSSKRSIAHQMQTLLAGVAGRPGEDGHHDHRRVALARDRVRRASRDDGERAGREVHLDAADPLHTLAGDDVDHFVGFGMGVFGERFSQLDQRGRRRAVQPTGEFFDGAPRLM